MLSLIAPVVMLVMAVLGLAWSVQQEVMIDNASPSAVPFWRLGLVPDLGGPTVVMTGWLAVVLATLLLIGPPLRRRSGG